MSRSDQRTSPETWSPVRRAAAAIASPIQRILADRGRERRRACSSRPCSRSSWANVWTASYADLWHTPIGVQLGPWSYVQPLHFWVNDGLMTVFFFVVGLEIRREIFEGELATSARRRHFRWPQRWAECSCRRRSSRCSTSGRWRAAGWAIPMATDIAFAVGVLTLLGSRVPVGLRVLLLALAVIDDIGAIVVIAVFYSAGIAPEGIILIGARRRPWCWSCDARACVRRSLYLVPGAIDVGRVPRHGNSPDDRRGDARATHAGSPVVRPVRASRRRPRRSSNSCRRATARHC